MRQVVS
ncbi:hypothetical protein D027_2814A, partial [Vibrio parahaemolyticus 861]